MIELLAPAGDGACLHAAVRAGADAVYLGAEQFNARRGAGNFTIQTLGSACDYAHLRGASIFLTVNTIVFPSELHSALELVRQAWRAGVDAFIVQDIGLAARIRETLPDARLHISTQMNTHNEAGMRAAARLGAERVTLARELSLPEIANLCDCAHSLGMQVEAFGHGALCICYSGQCFASSMVGGRSANRGMCAQACRLPYELHNVSVPKALPSAGPHLLSPKDLCSIDLLEQLGEAGVDSLKIEGRMKSPEYVQSVVGTYRAVLDRIQGQGDTAPHHSCATPPHPDAAPHHPETSLSHPDTPLSRPETPLSHPDTPLSHPETPLCHPERSEGSPIPVSQTMATPEEKQTLSEAFSRGFTQGYLVGQTDDQMMSYARPNNRGVRLGRVTRVGQGSVDVDCELPLEQGDIIEFWTGAGHFAHTVDSFQSLTGTQVRLPVTRKVGKGDRVFRVRSAQAAYVDDATQPKVQVAGTVELRIGKPAHMTLEHGKRAGFLSSLSIEVEGPVVEPARTKTITPDEVREHIDRLGGTAFELSHLDIELDDGVGMAFGALHALRTQAIEALQERMLQPWSGRTLPRIEKKARAGKAAIPVRQGVVPVCVLASNPACARAARKAGADMLYVPALNYKRGQAQVAGQLSPTVEQAGYPNRTTVALPVVDHDPVPGTREEEFGFDPWGYVRTGKPVLADSLGSFVRALEEGALAEVGPHVPVTNAATAQLLYGWGAARIWLSPELTLGQIQAIAEESSAPLGLTILGSQELMITEHCLLSSQGPCNHDCPHCARRTSPHFLHDRKGYKMPVLTDCCGRSHLYNAVMLDVAHAVPDILLAGVGALMVDSTLMNVEQTRDAVQRAVRARDLATSGKGAVARAEGTTTGHLFRAVE